MQKIFKYEEIVYSDDIFVCFQHLAKRRRDHVHKFYNTLLDITTEQAEPIKEDKTQKFVFHSMILSLQDVNILYNFFKDHTEDFT
jgi:hypothetical protein